MAQPIVTFRVPHAGAVGLDVPACFLSTTKFEYSIPLLLRLHCYLCFLRLLFRATRGYLVASLAILEWTRAPFPAPLVTRHRERAS